MSEEFDINKVTAEFVTSNINRMGHIASGILQGASTKIKLKLQTTYTGYLERLLARYSRTKSFLLRTEGASLYEFYVPMNLRTPARRIEGPGIDDVTAIAPRLIVTGSAGSGKSIFFRHLLLDTARSRAKVPIFIELRHFNQTKEDLRRGLTINLENNGFDLSDDYVEAALKNGHFAIFLDGFDELAPEVRDKMISDVQLFAQRYHNNWVLVSSRPDYELEGWQDFSLFNIEPLDLSQAEDLIDKLPFDSEIKEKFSRDLRKDLFVNHQSFLSNPLLLSIMLLTYGQVAHIPSKLNVFYNQAYEALFQRHDAFKGGFQRERRTGLDIQDFAQVFSLFCIQGYDKKRVEFSQMDALDLIGKAKEVCRLDFDNEDYLHDALQAVCLLLQEGLMIVFSHRSFQEYFTARFIARATPEVQESLIKKYLADANRDSVIKLLYEMRPEVVSEHFILPGLERLKETIGYSTRVRLPQYLRFLQASFTELDGYEGELSAMVRREGEGLIPVEFVWFVLHNCGGIVGWKGFRQSDDDAEVVIKLMKDVGDSAGGEVAVVSFDDLKPGDVLVKELSKLSGIWGIEALRTAIRIGDKIKENRESSRASLEDLLETSG